MIIVDHIRSLRIRDLAVWLDTVNNNVYLKKNYQTKKINKKEKIHQLDWEKQIITERFTKHKIGY